MQILQSRAILGGNQVGFCRVTASNRAHLPGLLFSLDTRELIKGQNDRRASVVPQKTDGGRIASIGVALTEPDARNIGATEMQVEFPVHEMNPAVTNLNLLQIGKKLRGPKAIAHDDPCSAEEFHLLDEVLDIMPILNPAFCGRSGLSMGAITHTKET